MTAMPLTVGSPTIPLSTQIALRAQPGVWNPRPLEEVRDDLAAEERRRDPVDLFHRVDVTHLDFTAPDGVVTATLIGQHNEPMAFTPYALRQLAEEILPGRNPAAKMDLLVDARSAGGRSPNGKGVGAQAATLLAAAIRASNTHGYVFRTVLDVNTGRRLIRGVVTDSYTPLSDVSVAQVALDVLGHLDVIDVRRSDDAIRIRTRVPGPAPELRTPIPTVEWWNGEVGGRSVGTIGGSWMLVCANGMTSQTTDRRARFAHVGDAETLRRKVAGAFRDEQIRAQQVVEEYTAARDVAVEDLFAFMEESLQGGGVLALSRRQIEASRALLTDSSVADQIASPAFTLGRAVDVVTLAAQREGDLDEQARMEAAAMRMAHLGLSAARRRKVANG
jgi:hypothetical protein